MYVPTCTVTDEIGIWLVCEMFFAVDLILEADLPFAVENVHIIASFVCTQGR